MNDPWLFDRLVSWRDRQALAGQGWSVRYSDLLASVAHWHRVLDSACIRPGSVVAFPSETADQSVALLLTLLARRAIAVPLGTLPELQRAACLEEAQVEFDIQNLDRHQAAIARRRHSADHPLILQLRTDHRPGLVLFSSGSTGRPKAMLHDLERLLERHRPPRDPMRLLSFLLVDHIGGLNTLCAGLAHGGTLVTVTDRKPETVCQAIQEHRVEVLPTTPTFLNLLLLSEQHRRFDLSSLRLITYGTEPMPASTLQRVSQAFPSIRLQQTYGLSELGILRSKSREDGSLWVQVGGDGYETRVVDGILWIRAQTAMLGYLNAPQPFDADGWFNTQDAVLQDGDWLHILGRTNELINVGGQKVFPAEVESVLLELPNVEDVTVHAEPNPILGQCVAARINLVEPEAPDQFKRRLRRFCQNRLAPHAIPMRIEITNEVQHSARCKRMRTTPTAIMAEHVS